MKTQKDFFSSGLLFLESFTKGKAAYQLDRLHLNWSSCWNGNNNFGGHNQEQEEHHHFFQEIQENDPILQAHFIHYKEKFGNVRKAVESGEAQALAIIVVHFQNNGVKNEALDPIIKKLGSLKENRKVSGSGLILRDLFLQPGTDKMKAIQYVGSLGSPSDSASNSDQLVLWTVGTEPLHINAEQLDQFRKLGHYGSSGNHRPSNNASNIMRPVIQPRNGKKLVHYDVQFGYIMSYAVKY